MDRNHDDVTSTYTAGKQTFPVNDNLGNQVNTHAEVESVRGFSSVALTESNGACYRKSPNKPNFAAAITSTAHNLVENPTYSSK